MPRRESTAGMLCCPIGIRERIACDEMRATLGLDSDANLVRTALYAYSVFVLGASSVDADLFRLQVHKGSRRSRNGHDVVGERKRGKSAASLPLFTRKKSA
jgi:hypothetical protein